MTLTTSTLILSLFMHDPLQKNLETLSHELIENLSKSTSDSNAPAPLASSNKPFFLRISGDSSQRSVPQSRSTRQIQNDFQKTIIRSLQTKEDEDLRRTLQSSLLTKIEEDNLRSAIALSLQTKEAEDLKHAFELSIHTKSKEDTLKIAKDNAVETGNNPSPTITLNTPESQTTVKSVSESIKKREVEADASQNTSSTNTITSSAKNHMASDISTVPSSNPTVTPERTAIIPETETVIVSETRVPSSPESQNVPSTEPAPTPAEQTIVEVAPVVPLSAPNVVSEKPEITPDVPAVVLPEVTTAPTQNDQNVPSTEPETRVDQEGQKVMHTEENKSEEAVISSDAPTPPPPPPVTPKKVLRIQKSQNEKSSQDASAAPNFLEFLQQSIVVSSAKKYDSSMKDLLLDALKINKVDVGLSDEDLDTLETHPLRVLQPLIDAYYDEERHEWSFGFTDRDSLMSLIKTTPSEEENPTPQKKVGKLTIPKDEADLSKALQISRGHVINEESTLSLLEGSAKSIVLVAPKAPTPSIPLSPEAQEKRAKFAQKRIASQANNSTSLLEQIQNKDAHVVLKTPTINPSQVVPSKEESLSRLMEKRRQALESSIDDDWD